MDKERKLGLTNQDENMRNR